MDSIAKSEFKWEKTPEYDISKDTRKNNMQKLWLRPTIPWKLDCDSDIMTRVEASEIYSQRLEHLGFIDNIIFIGIVVVFLIIVPFFDFCCNTKIRNWVSPVA